MLVGLKSQLDLLCRCVEESVGLLVGVICPVGEESGTNCTLRLRASSRLDRRVARSVAYQPPLPSGVLGMGWRGVSIRASFPRV